MLCLLLLLLALGYYINPAPGAKPVDNSAQTQAVPEAPAPPLASPRSASPEHSHDVPEVLASVVENQFEQKAHWFDAPALDSRGLYLGQSTPLTLDPS